MKSKNKASKNLVVRQVARVVCFGDGYRCSVHGAAHFKELRGRANREGTYIASVHTEVTVRSWSK